MTRGLEGFPSGMGYESVQLQAVFGSRQQVLIGAQHQGGSLERGELGSEVVPSQGFDLRGDGGGLKRIGVVLKSLNASLKGARLIEEVLGVEPREEATSQLLRIRPQG